MTGKDVLPEKDMLEKDMLEKAVAIKRFEYSPLGKEFKKQTSVAEKQYKKFDNAFESNKNEEVKTKSKKNSAKLNLVYNNSFTFYKYNKIKEFAKRSFDSKLDDLKEFQDKLELFYYDTIEIKPNNEEKIKDLEERKVVFNTALELYNQLLNIYKTQNDQLTKAQKKRIKVQNVPIGLYLENLSTDLYLDEDDLPPMPALKGDENVELEPEETTAQRIKLNSRKRKATRTGLKVLTPNKLLTRLPILLAQIKAGNNSYKLKSEIRQILYLLSQHNKIPKKICNNLIKSL